MVSVVSFVLASGKESGRAGDHQGDAEAAACQPVPVSAVEPSGGPPGRASRARSWMREDEPGDAGGSVGGLLDLDHGGDSGAGLQPAKRRQPSLAFSRGRQPRQRCPRRPAGARRQTAGPSRPSVGGPSVAAGGCDPCGDTVDGAGPGASSPGTWGLQRTLDVSMGKL